ncbi:hypothetical protein Dip510_001310 [Elusimicrobium posterum]|uniref:phosphatase domain-containing protein n=1 Tax=Elusimicrobium posterum TaxID=3116653 RepID=UPI003C760A91
MMKKPVVFFDIDGTLADITHRRHYVEGGKKNWAAFNKNMDRDIPNTPIVELYNTLWDSGMYEVIILSGREDVNRKVTEQWLTWNEIPFGRLLMRKKGDYRPDNIIKEEFLTAIRAEGKEVLFVIDDRQQVVDMWRRNGVTCLQCAPGDF